MKKAILTALILALFACPAGLGDQEYTEEDIPALLEIIGQLEEKIEELEQELETYRSGAWADDSPAAEFSGGCVTIADARAEYESRRYYYELMGTDADAISGEIKLAVLRDLAEDALLRAKAAELGVAEPDGETRALIEQEAIARYQAYRDYYAPYQYDPELSDEENEEKLTDYLAESGMSPDDVYRQVELELWSYQAALFDRITEGVTLSDEELSSYYNAAVESARAAWQAGESDYDALRAGGMTVVYNPPGYRVVSAIFLSMDEAALTEFYSLLAEMEDESGDQAAALARMDELYKELDGAVSDCLSAIESGADFDDVGAEYGGATQYYVSAASYDMYDGAFLAAAMGLENAGDVTHAQGSGGVYIIRYDGDVPEGPVPLEEIRDALAESALLEAKQALYNETVEKWIEEADIQYYPERF